jgi:hypothetical protein
MLEATTMRALFLVTVAALGLAFPAAAQAPDMLPEIVIGGEKPDAPDARDCAKGEKSAPGKGDYHCLNQGLKRETEQKVPQPNIPPIGTHSSDISRGLVNIPAVKQQYGTNYGVSVIPRAPPPRPTR